MLLYDFEDVGLFAIGSAPEASSSFLVKRVSNAKMLARISWASSVFQVRD